MYYLCFGSLLKCQLVQTKLVSFWNKIYDIIKSGQTCVIKNKKGCLNLKLVVLKVMCHV